MTDVRPDPKPRPRIRATSTQWRALRVRKLLGRPCRLCPAAATNLHHVVPRSQGGDDVEANLVEVCGSGTTGCHGATETGERCVDADGTAHDPDVVNARIRRFVAESHGHCLYLVKKLGGPDQARSFLDRYYPERPGAPDTTGGLDHAA